MIHNLASRSEKITKFLAAIANMGILKIDFTDTENVMCQVLESILII